MGTCLNAFAHVFSLSSSPKMIPGCVGLLLSISPNHIIACPNEAGSMDYFALSRFQTADTKVSFVKVRNSFLYFFKVKTRKYLQQKGLGKLVNGENAVVIRPSRSELSIIFQCALVVVYRHCKRCHERY